jgi:hypothetical protein
MLFTSLSENMDRFRDETCHSHDRALDRVGGLHDSAATAMGYRGATVLRAARTGARGTKAAASAPGTTGMIIIRTRGENFFVGILEPETEKYDEQWLPLRECKSIEEAMAWLSYLHGGEHPNNRPC